MYSNAAWKQAIQFCGKRTTQSSMQQWRNTSVLTAKFNVTLAGCNAFGTLYWLINQPIGSAPSVSEDLLPRLAAVPSNHFTVHSNIWLDLLPVLYTNINLPPPLLLWLWLSLSRVTSRPLPPSLWEIRVYPELFYLFFFFVFSCLL